MIPKIIHYCWFGPNKMPSKIKATIESWKDKLPDYQIIEWNDSNFNYRTCKFAKEAYESKKYAFVADYARLMVLKEYGGIYLDTDVDIKRTFDEFLGNKAFMSFESKNTLCTAVIGASENNEFIADSLNYYYENGFILPNGNYNNKPNSEILFEKLFDRNANRNIKYDFENITIYPVNIFCGKDYKTYKSLECSSTVAVHNLNASWYSASKKIKRKIKCFLIKMGMGFLWKLPNNR